MREGAPAVHPRAGQSPDGGRCPETRGRAGEIPGKAMAGVRGCALPTWRVRVGCRPELERSVVTQSSTSRSGSRSGSRGSSGVEGGGGSFSRAKKVPRLERVVALAAWTVLAGAGTAWGQNATGTGTSEEGPSAGSATGAGDGGGGSDGKVYGLPTPLPGVMSLAQFVTTVGMTLIFLGMGVLYMFFGLKVAQRSKAKKLWAKVRAQSEGALGVGVGGFALSSEESSEVSSTDSSDDEEMREERQIRREEHKQRIKDRERRKEERRADVKKRTAKFAANAFGKRILAQAALQKAKEGAEGVGGEAAAPAEGSGSPRHENNLARRGAGFTTVDFEEHSTVRVSSSEASSEAEHSEKDSDDEDVGGGVGDLGETMPGEQDSAVRQLFPEGSGGSTAANRVAPAPGAAAGTSGAAPTVVPKGWKLVRQETMKVKTRNAITMVINKKGKRVIRMPKGGRLALAFEEGVQDPCFRDLVDALARFHYARVSFKAAGVANLEEIKRMGYPLPAPVQIMLQATCLLLGEERSEKNRKKLLSKKPMKFSAQNHLRRNTPRRMSFSMEEINARLRHPRNLFYTEILKMEVEGTFLLGAPVSAVRMRLGDMVFDTQAVCEEMPCCARLLAWIKATVNLCVVLEDVPDSARDMAFEMCHKAGALKKPCQTAEDLQLGSKAFHRASMPRRQGLGDTATTDDDDGPMDTDSDASSPREQLGRVL